MDLKEHIKKLQSLDLGRELERAQRGATIRAVERASELTPPEAGGPLRGTHTLTGGMKQAWATSSRITPRRVGETLVTELANDRQYASYVDQGHRMDRHFVPGLYVNPISGLLEYDPAADVGLVVGTRTSYVPPKKIVERAVGTYRKELQANLRDIRSLIK